MLLITYRRFAVRSCPSGENSIPRTLPLGNGQDPAVAEMVRGELLTERLEQSSAVGHAPGGAGDAPPGTNILLREPRTP